MAGRRPGKRLAQSKGLIFPASSPVRSVTAGKAVKGGSEAEQTDWRATGPANGLRSRRGLFFRRPARLQRDIPAGSHIAVKHRKRDVIL